jgi:hypothetical protein
MLYRETTIKMMPQITPVGTLFISISIVLFHAVSRKYYKKSTPKKYNSGHFSGLFIGIIILIHDVL